MKRTLKHHLWCLILLYAAVGVPAPVRAQGNLERRYDTADVTIEAQLGLGDKFFGENQRSGAGHINHFALLVTNHRESVLEAVVDVDLSGEALIEGRTMPLLSKDSITVGPGSTKRFSFAIDSIDSPWGLINQWVEYAEIRVKDSTDDRLLWRRSNRFWIEELDKNTSLRSLIVGSASRVKIWPGAPSAWQGDLMPAPGERKMETLVIEPWQFPDALTCLTPVNAVILSPKMPLDALTLGQHRSLAEYVANSGLLIIPTEQSENWEKKIFVNSRIPFSLSEWESGRVWRYGKGKVAVVTMPRAGTEDAEAERWMYDFVDQHPEPPLMIVMGRMLDSIHDQLGPNALQSSGVVAIFFVLYALICGPCLYYIRKFRRPALLRAVLCIVGVFCVGSVAIGVGIRTVPGDMEWATVTEVFQGGGAIQHGKFHLNSAGNSNQTLSVLPKDTLLLRDKNPIGNQIKQEILHLNGDHAQYGNATVSIVPWGHAYWKSRSYLDSVKPITVSLRSPEGFHDKTEITVENPNTFFLNAASIHLSANLGAQIGGSNGRGIHTVVADLGSLPPGKTIFVKRKFRPHGRFGSALGIAIEPPHPPLNGQVAAYFTAELTASPSLAIQPATEFEIQLESHALVQRIEISGLPPFEELGEFYWPHKLDLWKKFRKRQETRHLQQNQILRQFQLQIQ